MKYALPAILTLALIVAVILQHVQKNLTKGWPTDKKKKLAGWLLGISLLLVVLQQGVLVIREIESSKQSQRARDTISELKQTVLEQNTNIVALKTTLATNKAIGFQTRAKIWELISPPVLSSDRVDLEKWEGDKSRREEIERLKQEQAEEERLSRPNPSWLVSKRIYEYTIQRFQEMLSQVATQRNQSLTSSLTRLPEVPANEVLGNIQVGVSNIWNFSVRVSAAPTLHIGGGGANFQLAANEVELIVNGKNQHPDTYRAFVDSELRDFFVQVYRKEKEKKR